MTTHLPPLRLCPAGETTDHGSTSSCRSDASSETSSRSCSGSPRPACSGTTAGPDYHRPGPYTLSVKTSKIASTIIAVNKGQDLTHNL